MKNKLVLTAGIAVILIVILSISVLGINPLTKEKKEVLDKSFNQVEERYNELLNRPMPKNDEELSKRVSDGEKLKNDHKKLTQEAKDAGYFDDILDTKGELLYKIDLTIELMNETFPAEYKPNIKEEMDVKDRAIAYIQELKEFRKKVEAVNENDDSKVKELIKEYESTLKYRKLRLE